MSLEVRILATLFGSILFTTALVGGRQLVVQYPQIGTFVKRLLTPSRASQPAPRVMWFRMPPKDARVVRLKRAQSRTGSPQPDHRITSERDIIKRPAYQELTADQIAFVEQCFTLNAILPKDKHFSCRNLYPNYGGTREKRMAELSAIKDRVEKKLQAERIANLTTNRPSQKAITT